jgi:hypothetical protein
VSVTVTVGSETSDGFDFTVKTPIGITSFSPATIWYDSVLTIKGKNFTSNIQVFVNNKEQENLTVVNDSTITVTMASLTYSGTVKLVNDGETDTVESVDTLKYKLTFTQGDNSFDDVGGFDFLMLDGGAYYLINSNGLIQYTANKIAVDTIIKSSSSVSPFKMFLSEDDTVYVTDNYGLIYAFKKGSAKYDTILYNYDEISYLEIKDITGDDENLYFTGYTNKKIFAYNFNSKETNPLTTLDEDAEGILLKDDILYVTTPSGILKLNTDGTDKKYVVEKESSGFQFYESDICIHPSGDMIVGCASSSYKGIYSIDADFNVSKNLTLTANGVFLVDESELLVVTAGSIEKIGID